MNENEDIWLRESQKMKENIKWMNKIIWLEVKEKIKSYQWKRYCNQINKNKIRNK